MTIKNTKLILNKKGQSLLEYILLLVVVIAVISRFKATIASKLQSLTATLGNQIDQVANDANSGQ